MARLLCLALLIPLCIFVFAPISRALLGDHWIFMAAILMALTAYLINKVAGVKGK
jgi:hypothetical protein